MIRILVVSPYPSVRAGLRALLQGADDLQVMWEVAGATDLAELWPPRPDVALIDDTASDAVLQTLAVQAPELPIVMLGGEPGRHRQDWQPAPRGYLTRDAGGDELIAAVRAVAQGLTVLDPSIAQSLLGAGMQVRADTGVAVDEILTHRELEVLQLLASGLPNKTIAVRLGISEHTAKFHVSSVLSKLGAASRTEAVTTAARRGLLLL